MSKDVDFIKGYFVYEYTFLDDLMFIRSPSEYFNDEERYYSLPDQEEFLNAIKNRFLEAGWEGDGALGIIWIPPFVDTGIEDTWGNYVWHVKQRNNGISYLLSEYPLDFQRLKEHSRVAEKECSKGIPKSIVAGDVEFLVKEARDIVDKLIRNLDSLSSVSEASVIESIQADLLLHGQSILIRTYQEFLDACYLSFLIEAMNGNRAKLKLRKSRVQLVPGHYIADDANGESHAWFTVQGVISDMWHAFKFEPYQSKLEMLFRAVDFKIENRAVKFLQKHILLRNCVQHNEGRLDAASLRQAGVEEFEVRGKTGTIKLRTASQILFTREELTDLATGLNQLGTEFDAHMLAYTSVRHYHHASGEKGNETFIEIG